MPGIDLLHLAPQVVAGAVRPIGEHDLVELQPLVDVDGDRDCGVGTRARHRLVVETGRRDRGLGRCLRLGGGRRSWRWWRRRRSAPAQRRSRSVVAAAGRRVAAGGVASVSGACRLRVALRVGRGGAPALACLVERRLHLRRRHRLRQPDVRLDRQRLLELLDRQVALLRAADQHHPEVHQCARFDRVLVQPRRVAQIQRLLQQALGLVGLVRLEGGERVFVQLGRLGDGVAVVAAIVLRARYRRQVQRQHREHRRDHRAHQSAIKRRHTRVTHPWICRAPGRATGGQ